MGGGGDDRALGARDVDVAVGTAHPQVAGRGADGRGAVRVLQDGGTIDIADAQASGAGGDLGHALDSVHGDRAVGGGQLERPGRVEADVTGRGLHPDFAEPALAEHLGPGAGHVDVRTRGQFDRHIDGAGAPDEIALLGRPDGQDAARVRHLGLGGRPYVLVPLRVAGPRLDDGVEAVARGELDGTGLHVRGDGDRFGSVERRHGCPVLLSLVGVPAGGTWCWVKWCGVLGEVVRAGSG